MGGRVGVRAAGQPTFQIGGRGERGGAQASAPAGVVGRMNAQVVEPTLSSTVTRMARHAVDRLRAIACGAGLLLAGERGRLAPWLAVAMGAR